MRLIDADKLDTRECGNNSQRTMWREIERLIESAPTVDVPQWIPVTPETMPESGDHVWLCCERRRCDGTIYRYVCDGEYIAECAEIVTCASDELAVKYDEATDEYYLKEGFYERIFNWDEYSSVVISDFVTHWMPLPELPEVE